MRRLAGVVCVILMTFYLALIFRSKSFVFLGYVEISVLLLLFSYHLFVRQNIRISVEVPFGLTECGKTIPVRIAIRNYGRLPSGKISVCLLEGYAVRPKETKVFFTSSVDGKAGEEIYASTVIEASWSPQYVGKAVIQIQKARSFDLLGILFLPLPKKAYQMQEEVTVLPQIFEVPVEARKSIRDFTAERQIYAAEEIVKDTRISEVREYRPGDRLRSIHWKLSAKEGELMVREETPLFGCPILLFLDLAGMPQLAMPAALKRKRGSSIKGSSIKRREAFFTVLASLSAGMAAWECRHYVVWYDGQENDVMRHCVEKEEDVYVLFLKLDGLGVPPDGFDLPEEYRQKYRGEPYAVKAFLSGDLQLALPGGQVLQYSEKDLEGTLTKQVVAY